MKGATVQMISSKSEGTCYGLLKKQAEDREMLGN